MDEQAHRQKFMEQFKGKLNLSCHAWDGKITSFADPKVEAMYAGWVLGFTQAQAERKV